VLNAAPSVDATAPAVAAPVAEVPPTVDASVEVSAVLQEWAAAWSAKDLNAYLANYSPDFTSADGKTRPAWDELRKQRITSKSSISVNLTDIKITVSGDTATAEFTQQYDSNALKETSKKALTLEKRGTAWLIAKEVTVK
jgi:ketosteroid isomerase-like protein